MGVVYKAFDLKLERYVALKILHNHAVKQEQFVERFKREAKNQAKLTHPNIVPVYEFAEDKNIMGIAMEYVEGESLEQLINRKGSLDITEAIEILEQILSGISYAHKKGFIHRDIKPSNVIINKEGVTKIMDFGISKALNEISITKTGAKVGTIMYMSPEQVRAEEPTIQSDIYSIGITFYEMLAGKPPFDYHTEFEILEAHLKKIPQKMSIIRPDIPSETDIIFTKALDKNILKRYGSCEEFLEDVHKLKKIVSHTVENKKEIKIKTKPKRVNWKSVAIGFVSLVLFVLFGTIAYKVAAGIWKIPTKDISKKDTNIKEMGLPVNRNTSVWQHIRTSTDVDLNSIAFIDDSLGFACGDSGTVIKTTDGGSSWENIAIPSVGKRKLLDIEFSEGAKGIITGENGLLLITDNFGFSWNQIELTKLFGDLSEPPRTFKSCWKYGKIFILAYNGYIFQSSNYGKTWERTFSDKNDYFYNIVFTDEQTGFIVGKNGVILKSTDAGYSWNKITKFTANYIKGIDFNSSAKGITVGNDEMFVTEDGGTSWERNKNCNTNALSGIKCLGNTCWIAYTTNGDIMFSEDDGDKWEKMSNSDGVYLTSIFKNNRTIYFSGTGGKILRWKSSLNTK